MLIYSVIGENMNPVRKIFGFFVAIIIGVLILFCTIVAIGLTKAAVSPEFLSDMPQELIEKLPSALDQLYSQANKDDFIDKKEYGFFINVMKKTDIPPSKILESSGIMAWMEGELKTNLKKLGEILRGEIPPENITIDMHKLKKSILSPAITSYIRELISALPECSEVESEKWKNMIYYSSIDSFPECRPKGLEITSEIVFNIQHRIANDIPKDITIFEGSEYIPRNINVMKFVSTAAYFLLIIPLIFIIIGSIIAATTKGGFLRWSGFSILTGGLSAYTFGNILNNIIPISNGIESYLNLGERFSSRYSGIVAEKVVEFSNVVLKQLFSPVAQIGGVIAVIGLIIFALSFLSRGND